MADSDITAASILARLEKLLARYEAGLITERELTAHRATLEALLKALELTEIESRIADLEKLVKKEN